MANWGVTILKRSHDLWSWVTIPKPTAATAESQFHRFAFIPLDVSETLFPSCHQKDKNLKNVFQLQLLFLLHCVGVTKSCCSFCRLTALYMVHAGATCKIRMLCRSPFTSNLQVT